MVPVRRGLPPAEVDEDSTEVVGVLLHPVVERLDLLLVQEPQHVLLQCSRPLARDDLHQRSLRRDGFVDHGPEGAIDLLATVVDVMHVQLELHRTILLLTSDSTPASAACRVPNHSPGSGRQPQKMPVGSRSTSASSSSMFADGATRSYSWKRRLRSRQYSDHVLLVFV